MNDLVLFPFYYTLPANTEFEIIDSEIIENELCLLLKFERSSVSSSRCLTHRREIWIPQKYASLVKSVSHFALKNIPTEVHVDERITGIRYLACVDDFASLKTELLEDSSLTDPIRVPLPHMDNKKGAP